MDSELRFQRLVFTKRKPTRLTSKELLTAKNESKKTGITTTVGSRTRSKAGHNLFKKHKHEHVANTASKVGNNSTFEERLEKQNVYDAEESRAKPFTHTPANNTVNLGEKYKEWGPSINGYRFLDKEEKVNDYNVPNVEGQDSYGLSYPEDAEPLTKHLQTYDEYIQNWRENTRLYWPNEENLWTCVSYDSIKQFLRGSQNLAAFKKRLKVERIRWHPDKMKQNIDCNEKDLILVTETFQLINKLWEDFFKVKHS
ncbi:Hypothetical protein PP7435_CHR4-0949 [Komagataella phaffii CBS 7435]|uniref:Uncharacterized protein n=2 Tax=Komagataella phaffii TaxID=460519 RepID=C4R6R9_KOMPG|nr:Hypothetical protein PAS_chr4_0068 [Komagataella phaffii GS115]AOA64814.1 GQ67_04374T0 [Komagataella phaffii]CAH2451363.1 Hypothetical protein BQ9382_C4-4965 [Komagataella phaffii CBS 7435]AOA69637.1 GQ68_04346T0 [Komagataella phaffii GS115]CAY71294.1 Hypothetical protein PAS_chr4_0068 [Komagataella phaffii GS115]CCA41099.1 Hypothetical protein PP7435_CHR4-0949 [Komagataella phaffii CBS 7435]